MFRPFSGARPLLRQSGLLVLVAVTGCFVPGADARSGDWAPFESKEGNFRALFPRQPSYTTSSDGREHRYTAQYQLGKRLLRAAYELDYDTTITIPERFAAVGEMEGVRGSVTPAPVSLGAHRGMEATYELREGSTTTVIRHRIYHVGTTSYQEMAVVEKGQRAEAEIERFFSSFQLLSQ